MNVLDFSREVYMVAGGIEVRGQEELPRQKHCKTLTCVPAESCGSVSPDILKKSKIRYMSQVAQTMCSRILQSEATKRVHSTFLHLTYSR